MICPVCPLPQVQHLSLIFHLVEGVEEGADEMADHRAVVEGAGAASSGATHAAATGATHTARCVAWASRSSLQTATSTLINQNNKAQVRVHRTKHRVQVRLTMLLVCV